MPADEASSSTEPESEGVLLYYKYVKILDVPLIVNWYEDTCLQLGLIGRIRVSLEGVNVTVGGSSSALEEHIRLVSNHPSLGSCDFKVARCKEPLLGNPLLVQECGFDSLSVRAVKEVVSLGHGATHVSPAEAGVHLSPAEFQQHLLAAAFEQKNAWSKEGDGKRGGVVVLDARNMYETRIGHFQQLPGVEFCDPGIRQFSELPAWFDANEDRLRDKQVYMYCTGGVRCERASAYLRVKGPGFRDVYQLSGGIQRYLEAFPDGGLFEGKNFVFDPRCAVGSLDARKVGRCLLCDSPYDDYAPRCRCALCRVLVLVCDTCREKGDSEGHVCELCQKSRVGEDTDGRAGLREDGADGRFKRGMSGEDGGLILGRGSKGDGTAEGIGGMTRPGNRGADQETETLADSRTQSAAPVMARPEELGRYLERPSDSPRPQEEALSAPRRRLRVLCLHGFRQTGQGLKGRLAAFQRSVKDLVEMVFVDGPHQLPCVFYPKEWTGGAKKEEGRGKKGGRRGSDAVLWEVEEGGVVGGDDRDGECVAPEMDGKEHGQLEGQSCHGRCRDVGCVENAGNPADGTRVTSAGKEVQALPKFAWLVSPEQLQEIVNAGSRVGTEVGATAEGPGAKGRSRETVSAAERPWSGLEKGVGSCGEDELHLDTPGEGPGEEGSCTGTDLGKERSGSKKEKEAPGQSGQIRLDGAEWRPAAVPFGPLQYLTQTAGLNTSLAHLRRVFAEQGPFDGVLGFSQGAAVAAALCRHRGGGEGPLIAFKFAVLCSGFRSPAEEAADGSPGVIDIPSLHIYGAQKGRDRQIKVAESEKLAEQFEPSRRVVVEHSAGHIVPISKNYVTQYRTFFSNVS